jgi:hypothetical protein
MLRSTTRSRHLSGNKQRKHSLWRIPHKGIDASTLLSYTRAAFSLLTVRAIAFRCGYKPCTYTAVVTSHVPTRRWLWKEPLDAVRQYSPRQNYFYTGGE